MGAAGTWQLLSVFGQDGEGTHVSFRGDKQKTSACSQTSQNALSHVQRGQRYRYGDHERLERLRGGEETAPVALPGDAAQREETEGSWKKVFLGQD